MTIVRRTYDHGYFETAMYRTFPESQRNRQRLRLILNHHQEGRLLEIGPGTGEFLNLAARSFEVEGIEISPHAVKAAPSELRSKIRVGNIEMDPLVEGHYRVVAAFNVLEHLKNPQAAIDKVRRAITPGGCFVGSMPCNSGLVGHLYTQATNFFDRTHCSTFAPSRWRAMFLRSGFTTINFFGEIPMSPHYCLYLKKGDWPWLSANLMFICS